MQLSKYATHPQLKKKKTANTDVFEKTLTEAISSVKRIKTNKKLKYDALYEDCIKHIL